MGDQERLEEIVAWYAAALGLENWRIELRADDYANDGSEGSGDAWISDYYDNAIIGVKPGAEQTWTHDTEEQTAVHELVHLLIEPLARMYRDLLHGMDLPSRAYNALDNQYDRLYERAFERIALGLVSCAHTPRSGAPPKVGTLLRKRGAEAIAVPPLPGGAP
jgi:hypothetical protein